MFLFLSSPTIIYFFKIENPLKNLDYFLLLSLKPLCKPAYDTFDFAKSQLRTHKVSLPPLLCKQRMEERRPLLSHHPRTNRFSVLTGGKILIPVVFGLFVAPRTLAVL